MSAVESVGMPEEPEAVSRQKRKNDGDGISSSPKRQKISDTESSATVDDSAGARTARELDLAMSENLFPDALFELEKDFISTIGVHEEQERSQEILSKMRALIEQATGRTLAEKREEQLEILYAIDGVRERVERIRSASGFKETHQLLKYIDIIQLNMKTAETSPTRKADLDKLTRELRRVIQRIQAIQTRMQRLTLKVNLPRNEASFADGLGEGCFVVVEEQTKALFDVNREGGIYVGILLNTPVYKEWFHLKEGDPVLFCMKGQLRPVAFVDQTSVVDQLRGMFNSDGEHVHPALSASSSAIARVAVSAGVSAPVNTPTESNS